MLTFLIIELHFYQHFLQQGVGLQLQADPYENFRKNKGAAFITRMKARAEERS